MWSFVIWTVMVQLASADMPEITADMESIGASGFSCEGKVIGGYYADVDSGCQMFHVCTLGQEGEIRDIKFLCLAGTIFDQETRVCERIDEVDCSESPKYYHLNLELFGRNAHILATGRKVPRGDSGAVDDQDEEGNQHTFEDDYDDYEDDNRDVIREEFREEVSTTTVATTSSTPNATTTTTVTPTTEATTTTTTTTEPSTTTQADLQSIETVKPVIQETIFTPNQSPAAEQQQPLVIQHDLLVGQSHVSENGTPGPSVITIIRRPETLSARELAEEEDLREILEQIEADVPRIQSIGRSGKRFPRRSKRDEPKRRPGSRRTTKAPVTVRTGSNDQSFQCLGRVQGGFYADVPSGCRKFHICGLGKKSRVVTHTFSCGVGLAFDQATLTCQDIAKVDCELSPSLYHLNDPAYRPDPEAVDTFQSFKEKSVGTAGTSYHVSYD